MTSHSFNTLSCFLARFLSFSIFRSFLFFLSFFFLLFTLSCSLTLHQVSLYLWLCFHKVYPFISPTVRSLFLSFSFFLSISVRSLSLIFFLSISVRSLSLFFIFSFYLRQFSLSHFLSFYFRQVSLSHFLSFSFFYQFGIKVSLSHQLNSHFSFLGFCHLCPNSCLPIFCLLFCLHPFLFSKSYLNVPLFLPFSAYIAHSFSFPFFFYWLRLASSTSLLPFQGIISLEQT